MKPSRFEVWLYSFGVVFVLAGTAARIGHLITTGQGYAVLLVGIALSIGGRVLANKRMRQLQQQNQQLKAQPVKRKRKP